MARTETDATRLDPPAELIPPSTRPERVLAALRHFASPGGFVCQTTGTLAHWLGVSAETVRRGIADLLRLGWIEPTGLRRGKAVQYRIVELPHPIVESPQPSTALRPATEQTPTAAPLRGGAAGRDSCGDDHHSSRPNASAYSPAEEYLDNFEWTPELRAEYAALARALALRYSGASEIVAEFKDVGPGECGDCRHDVTWRGRYGKFEVCRPCLARRHAVALKFEVQAIRAGEPA